MALFGEKYSDVVRTVAVPGFSLELCGGTHVRATGEIGAFLITVETSIAAGVRRIEAITGEKVVDYLQESREIRSSLSSMLNTKENAIIDKVNELLAVKKALEKEIQKLQSAQLQDDIDQILDKAETINGVRVIIHRMDSLSANQLKELGDTIREKSQNTAALLISSAGGKLSLVCVLSEDLIASKKLHAGDLVRETAKVAGGGGGGRPHLATAGAKDTGKINQAINKFRDLIRAK